MNQKEIIMNDISSQLNEHNKQEYPPMHTAEHLLNATMVKMFGCSRSNNAHIERKKSKCDYELPSEPTAQQIKEVEDAVNTIIQQNLAVTEEYTNQEAAKDIVDLGRLPDGASDTLRLIRIGEDDVCACVGAHVKNTSEIGTFIISSHSYADGVLRIRFKLK